MPTWGEQLKELETLKQREIAAGGPKPGTPSPFDILRRTYMQRLSKETGRAVIVYATSWLENKPGAAADAPIALGDLQGFMETTSNITEKKLDLFMHSPGGSAEAAESIIEYLRTRFTHIRVIVPVAAMSAATMVALAADEILMGNQSQLGPIDPQFTIQTPEGPRSAPGQAILDQFEMAKKECNNPANLGAWLPILRSYAPGLIARCENQQDLSEKFVEKYLVRYMFKRRKDKVKQARAAAKWFADFKQFQSHGRRVSGEEARKLNIRVTRLESNPKLEDAVLSVHHAVQHTFGGTPTTKLIENQHGRAWIKGSTNLQIKLPFPSPPGSPGPINLRGGQAPPQKL